MWHDNILIISYGCLTLTWSIIWTNRGHTKAAVFPLPVFAIPMISRPANATGTPWRENYFWMTKKCGLWFLRHQQSTQKHKNLKCFSLTCPCIGIGDVYFAFLIVFISLFIKTEMCKARCWFGWHNSRNLSSKWQVNSRHVLSFIISRILCGYT